MNNFIIIEGPDCCGKTTLATTMQKEIPNSIYWHCTASKALFPGLADYHQNILDNAEKNFNVTFILDRFWPSEMAYGLLLFRPHSGYGVTSLMLHTRISKLGGMYIFCMSKNGLKRYKDANRQIGSDTAHILTDANYRQVYKNYTTIYQGLTSGKISKYEIEEEGKDMVAYTKRTYEELQHHK